MFRYSGMVKPNPRTNPEILEAWKRRETELMSEGMSRYQAHLTIARKAIGRGVSRYKIDYWLNDSFREREIQRAANYYHHFKKYGRDICSMLNDLPWFFESHMGSKECSVESIKNLIKEEKGISIPKSVLKKKLKYLVRLKNNPLIETRQGGYIRNENYYDKYYRNILISF